jgi:hypothetical protein
VSNRRKKPRPKPQNNQGPRQPKPEPTGGDGISNPNSEGPRRSADAITGMARKAAEGEWMGGPIPPGFDVACYYRATGKELWRVLNEGPVKRLKVYPDGSTERYDGEDAFPAHQKKLELLRLAPTRDKGKREIVARAFRKFLTEAISPHQLGHWLHGEGLFTSGGGRLQSHHVERMLRDPAYVGRPAWNKDHRGKFHRRTATGLVPDPGSGRKTSANAPADWVQLAGEPLYEAMVDPETFAAVQDKLGREGKGKRRRTIRSPANYLAGGFLVCAHCGEDMVVGSKTGTYVCGTYARHCRQRTVEGSPCRPNRVSQAVIQEYIDRWLRDERRTLDQLLLRPDDPEIERKWEEEGAAWLVLREGVEGLTHYLQQRFPDDYAALLAELDAREAEPRESPESGAEAPPGFLAEKLKGRLGSRENATKPPRADPGEFVEMLLALYRRRFDPDAVEAELNELDAEHTRLHEEVSTMKTERTKQKTWAKLYEVEARMRALELEKENCARQVKDQLRHIGQIQADIFEAEEAMRAGADERSLRRKAEALRRVIDRMVCGFEPVKAPQSDRLLAKLKLVTIFSHSGECREYPVP